MVRATLPYAVDAAGNNVLANPVVSLAADGSIIPGGSASTPDNLATTQVSVAATATVLAAARAGRKTIIVENMGTTAVYLGGASVTTGNGLLLPGVVGASVTLSFTGALSGIAASGTQTVAVAETY